MLPTERLEFSAIAHRPKLELPDGARLVVWVIVNVEEWDPTQAMPRTVFLTPPAGGAPMPDIPNWAWHEYGNRVGFWRMLEMFDDFRIPAVLAINGSAIASYGAIVRAARERQWEFIGHGFSQKNMQKVADERDDIRKTSAAIVAPPFAIESFTYLDADVRQSILRVRNSPFVPHRDRVRGFVYDVTSHRLREVQ